jgi:hypothetical protein
MSISHTLHTINSAVTERYAKSKFASDVPVTRISILRFLLSGGSMDLEMQSIISVSF